MRCLMVTPVPFLPATQGNAVAVGRLCEVVRSAGYNLHLVYSAMEGADPGHIRAMAESCDTLDVLPYPGHASQPDGLGYPLDGWFDQAVVGHVAALCRTWHFDFAVIHYVWMSAAAAAMPADLPKILFTHDRFAERHLTLARAGVAPTWYSIAAADEAVGLARCDHIIAVTEEEAKHFRRATDHPVHVVGMAPRRRRRPEQEVRDPRRLSVGYFGSSNPSNAASLRRFLAALVATGALGQGIELAVAGPVSSLVPVGTPGVRTLGVLVELNDLFDSVDLVVNPEGGGTGLRMKSLEILAADLPLVATREAMSGLAVTHPLHLLETPEALAARLPNIVAEGCLEALRLAGRDVIDAFAAKQAAALGGLIARVASAGRRLQGGAA
jgi:hypothetical protein